MQPVKNFPKGESFPGSSTVQYQNIVIVIYMYVYLFTCNVYTFAYVYICTYRYTRYIHMTSHDMNVVLPASVLQPPIQDWSSLSPRQPARSERPTPLDDLQATCNYRQHIVPSNLGGSIFKNSWFPMVPLVSSEVSPF